MAEVKGGDKLAARLKELSRKVAKKATVRVGFLEDAKYPDGTSVAMVAFLQDYGTKTVPATAFFRNMVKDKSPDWGDSLSNLLVSNDFDAGRALTIMGDGIRDQLEQAIIDTSGPPLSPVTLMLRRMKKDKPGLVVTGAVVGEAAQRVKDGKSSAGVSTKRLEDTKVMLMNVGSEVT